MFLKTLFVLCVFVMLSFLKLYLYIFINYMPVKCKEKYGLKINEEIVKQEYIIYKQSVLLF